MDKRLGIETCPRCGLSRTFGTSCECSHDSSAPRIGGAQDDLAPRYPIGRDADGLDANERAEAPEGAARQGGRTVDALEFVDELSEHMQDGPPVTLEAAEEPAPHRPVVHADDASAAPEIPTHRDPWPLWIGVHVERRWAALAAGLAAFALGLALGEGDWRPGALLAVVAMAMVLWGRTPAFAAGGLAAFALFTPASVEWSVNYGAGILLALVIVCAPGYTVLGWLAPALGCAIAAAIATLVVGPYWGSNSPVALAIWSILTVSAIGLSHWLIRLEKLHDRRHALARFW